MSIIDTPIASAADSAPEQPVPMEPSLNIRQLTELLVHHLDLHDGLYDLMTHFSIGTGPVGPSLNELSPGLMVGLTGVGLIKVPTAGPNSVDAAQINPSTASAPASSKSRRTTKSAAQAPE